MLRTLILAALSIFVQASNAQSTTIYFEFDKWDITPSAIKKLDSLTALQVASISINGHCDQLGSQVYNDLLSQKRADAVKEYLTVKGIANEKIIIVKGFGETQPVLEKLDVESRKLNRRVTIAYLLKEEIKAAAPTPPVVNKIEAPEPKKPVPLEKLIDEIKDSTTKAGDKIILKNINFYGGRHVFLPEAYPSLNELLETMKAIPTLKIEIHGHICCISGDGDGLDIDTGFPNLSYNRSKAVYEFLLRNGIERRRMQHKGFGHKYPIIEYERSEAEKTINRRVEIKILQK